MNDHRSQEQHGIQHVGDKVDDISNLPDCILHHILSFMPTKEVVKTSILSKRWKTLWASVSNIDFDDALLYACEVDGRKPPHVTCFMNFVEKVLQLRDASNMEKFRLSCRVCFSASRIHSWISAAIRHNVRELDLCLFVEDPSVLPRSMFDSMSLISLKIEMNCVLELPPCICFPCLKTLHLSLVTFPNDDSTQNLFLGCPVLEELAILDCEWMNLKNVAIFSSTLKSLTIDDLPCFGQADNLSGCKIKIDAANLISLKYIGYLSNPIFLYNVPSLVQAYIHIPLPHERPKEVACCAVDLLKSISNVVSLGVSNRTVETLICSDNVLGHLPLFQSLIHLELSMEIRNQTVGILMGLLNCFPNLQSLSFEGFEHSMRLGENHSIWLSLPKCMLSCLKTITFKNFHGNDSEICFLKCFLKYALVLERMNICCSITALGNPKKKRDVKKELEMIVRGSTACAVSLS